MCISTGNPSLSSTDATKCYLNIDYKPLNDLRGMISASMGKSADLLGAPVNRPTVEANANNLKHLTIQEILGYHLPAGENVSIHVFAQMKGRCMLATGTHELI